MKYLILGVNGMAGHMAASYLSEQGQQVWGFARSVSPFCETICGDARKETDLSYALDAVDFDYVVNCIGVLNRFVDMDPADGIYINSVLPHLLQKLLEKRKAKLIHISTDCVFRGDQGGYTEDDFPDAVTCYGRSKALGEIIDGRNLTIRTSIIGPELKKDGIGLFHWFMMQKGEVPGYQDVWWSGVTTLQLAKAVLADAEKPQAGLYHLVNNEPISKYQLLGLFNRYCREEPVRIRPDKTVKNDKSLVNTHPSAIFSVPAYEDMIREMAVWIRRHKKLYQQYQGA